MPKNSADQRIIPVPPRPFPAEFHDLKTPVEPLLRSDYAVIACILVILAFGALILRRLLA